MGSLLELLAFTSKINNNFSTKNQFVVGILHSMLQRSSSEKRVVPPACDNPSVNEAKSLITQKGDCTDTKDEQGKDGRNERPCQNEIGI